MYFSVVRSWLRSLRKSNRVNRVRIVCIDALARCVGEKLSDRRSMSVFQSAFLTCGILVGAKRLDKAGVPFRSFFRFSFFDEILCCFSSNSIDSLFIIPTFETKDALVVVGFVHCTFRLA